MMAMDTHLQAWLDTASGAPPGVIIPYVQSRENRTIQYRLTATKQGVSGTSTIRQSGDVRLTANTPTALTRFSLSVGKRDQCKIELVLFAHGHAAGAYQFACPQTR